MKFNSRRTKQKKKFNKQALKAKRMEELKAENERLVSERTVFQLEVDRIINDLQNLIKYKNYSVMDDNWRR